MGVTKRELRIVFAGTAGFAVPSLEQLAAAGHEIALVVTQLDRLGGRGLKPLASPVKTRAVEMGFGLYQPDRIRDEAAQARIVEYRPDALIVVAYGQILPSSLIGAPRLGTINVHASLLPRHRGPAPVEWAILSGDSETGVTIMQMDAGVDTGPIFSQERLSIKPDESAGQLERQLASLGAGLLVRTIEGLQSGRIKPTPQASDGVSYAPRLKSENGKLDPTTMSAVEIDRRVRALSERIGTWVRLKDVDLKVLRGHVDASTGEGVAVTTANGVYVVDEVQPPGKRPMGAAAWLRGRR
jgi:methionyl-tRNA formyltransferase